MNSPRTLACLLFVVAALGLVAIGYGQELRKIRDAGPNASRVNVVLVAEGYTAAESNKFFSDAGDKLAALVGNEAFVSFKDVINGFAIFVASNESGTDIPSQGIVRDTYFNTSFGISGVDRLLAINGSVGQTRLNTLLFQYVPDYDIVILIVNSTKYGGSGGAIAVTSLDPSSNEIVLHEIGHSFAGLSDEYVEAESVPLFPPREGINITQKTDRATIPWRAFILPSTPVPTTTFSSDTNFVGLFEGAYFRAQGFYRPTYDSKMRELGVPFGPVNLRAFSAAFLRLNINNATTSPGFTAQPTSQGQIAGSSATLSVTPSGIGPFAYQWSLNGTFIPGATSSTYVISSLSATNAGDYRVEVSNAIGAITSTTATLTVVPGGARLYAISCRAMVGIGGDVLIPGIIVAGSGDQQVIVRAKGPSISGVSGTLARPQLKLYQVGVATPLAVNTGWDTGTTTETLALQHAFVAANLPPLPGGSPDCALLATLRANTAYTAVVSGLDNTTGVALVEVYEAAAGTARLSAISCRARVGTGGDILIPGIIVVGNTSKQLVIRASAPAGVDGVLAQPQLTLFNSGGQPIAANVGWSTAANADEIFSATAKCGLANFPPGSPNCAMFVTLPPGGYTAQVSGVNNTTGVALIEVYEVP